MKETLLPIDESNLNPSDDHKTGKKEWGKDWRWKQDGSGELCSKDESEVKYARRQIQIGMKANPVAGRVYIKLVFSKGGVVFEFDSFINQETEVRVLFNRFISYYYFLYCLSSQSSKFFISSIQVCSFALMVKMLP
ncbi:hypothetical protein L2E82_18086 [Cichorium intybus]|uniref:Uncharacterized protein n=1 Tax=Cichorium intybus TaxID=13427 RepID=A0ACB9F8P6_CICIN|nr:hypothetical protein L2E82_18086 [Cichorium intybus]